MDFSIDYGTIKPATPAAPSGPLFASIDGRVSALANDEVAFYDPATDTNHVMTQHVLQALDLTREFRPLDVHVRKVAESLPGLQGQGDAVRRVFDGLIKRGLLQSDSDFLQRFQHTADIAQAAVAGVFIRACDRPAQVRQLLGSLREYETRFAPRHRYVLVDDSQCSESIREHAQLLAQFAEASGCRTEHVTRERWSGWVDALVRELPEHGRVLRRLLQRDAGDTTARGGGIGRNLITLLAAQRRYLLLDDDFVFPLRRHPEYAPGLVADARGWAVRTYGARLNAMGAGTETDADPVAAHLAACGATLSQAVRHVDGCRLSAADLLGVAPSRNAALRPDKRIALTSNGHRGASGSASPAWLYMLSPAERAGFANDRDTYLATHRDPSVWFGASRFVCGSGTHFTPFAIDNSTLMPCTSPWGRGEDALYNALVRVLRPDVEVLDFPLSVGHAPLDARKADARGWQADTPDLNHCFTEFARHVGDDLSSASARDRIGVFAARLDDLAGASDSALGAYLREYLGYRRSEAIQRMQHAAKADAKAPLHWVADLRSQVEANGRALVERTPPRFAGWPEAINESDGARRFRDEAGDLGAGLRAWPAAWDVAASRRWLPDVG